MPNQNPESQLPVARQVDLSISETGSRLVKRGLSAFDALRVVTVSPAYVTAYDESIFVYDWLPRREGQHTASSDHADKLLLGNPAR